MCVGVVVIEDLDGLYHDGNFARPVFFSAQST